MIKNSILKIWFWITFLKNKEKLPTASKMINPKMEYEVMSGAFIWEDEGLWELRNHHMTSAFKYVINYRMSLVVGEDNDAGCMRSRRFDRQMFKMAKRFFPNWIGFDKSRCTYNPEIAERMMRIIKVANWRMEKMFDEEY